MLSPWLDALQPHLHAAPARLALLVSVSAWTAATCHAAMRHAEEARPGQMFTFTPRLSSIALGAAGVVVWGANGLEQAALAGYVASVSIAFMLGWEVGGVLERYLKQWM